ncbi:MAG: hypothetical protein ABI361_11150 [Nitrososphaera sp.]
MSDSAPERDMSRQTIWILAGTAIAIGIILPVWVLLTTTYPSPQQQATDILRDAPWSAANPLQISAKVEYVLRAPVSCPFSPCHVSMYTLFVASPRTISIIGYRVCDEQSGDCFAADSTEGWAELPPSQHIQLFNTARLTPGDFVHIQVQAAPYTVSYRPSGVSNFTEPVYHTLYANTSFADLGKSQIITVDSY